MAKLEKEKLKDQKVNYSLLEDADKKPEKESGPKKHYGFFHKDNPVNMFLYLVGSLMLLNIYFLLCCLPVITIGASITALNKVCLDIRIHRDVPITKTFFKTFASNFIDSTLVWIVMCGFGSMLGFGIYKFVSAGNGLKEMCFSALLVAGLLIILIIADYIFLLIARYENNLLDQIRNAFIIGIANFGWTLFFWVIWGTLIASFILNPYLLHYLGWVWLMFGFAWVLYMLDKAYVKILRKIEMPE